MSDLDIYLLTDRAPRLVGRIVRRGEPYFSYASMVADTAAECITPRLSASLSSGSEHYRESQFRPYFEGLVPEGSARDALAGELGIPSDDYLGVLEACGRECIGDVIVVAHGFEPPSWSGSGYSPIQEDKLRAMLSSDVALASENAASRPSLAGTQGKVGLARYPGGIVDAKGWLRPRGLAASTHILKTSHLRDLPELEYLCMRAASALSIRTAEVTLLNVGRTATAVRRFDRTWDVVDGELHVLRLHQEDFAQALGVPPHRKYAELEGDSVRTLARLIREESTNPLPDLEQLSKVLAYNFAIGNCDAHLKSFSLLHPTSTDMRQAELSPAYDFVSTTYFPRFSRDMAMAYGSARSIDEIGPDDLVGVARALGITTRSFRSVCQDVASSVGEFVLDAADAVPDAPESLPFVAEDLVDDMRPRLEVLLRFSRGA